jgi:uncharacterized repeat protein (TIGR03803 family)
MITTLAKFNGQNGANPIGGVTFDPQGNLYGTTVAGGSIANLGVVWKLPAGTNTIEDLTTFEGIAGVQPTSDLVLDAHGNLFGTTFSAGPSHYGTVWEIPSGMSSLATIAAFAGADGANPYGSLAMGADGTLYGTTLYGGDNGDGTVFQLTPTTITPEPSSFVLMLTIGMSALATGTITRRPKLDG